MSMLKHLVLIPLAIAFIFSVAVLQTVSVHSQEVEGEPTPQPDSRFLNPSNPSPFEAMPGELVSEEIELEKLTEEERLIRDRNLRADELWKNADYRNYDKSFAVLHKLSKAFANNKYRQALSSYQAGINTVIKMRENEELLRKASEEETRLSEKWYWQVIDRKAREERKIHTMQRKAKLEAVSYFTRSIHHLDEILNKEIRENPTFKQLLSAVYRNWVLHQFDLGNLPQCIPVLELYVQINENEKEYQAHKYLSQCYAFQENLYRKYDVGTEEQSFRFRYKKNVHLLRATELKYGKDSAEYKHIVNLLNRDEIIATQE